jgi:hypothetical protein
MTDAQVAQANREGNTALTLATASNQPEIVAILKNVPRRMALWMGHHLTQDAIWERVRAMAMLMSRRALNEADLQHPRENPDPGVPNRLLDIDPDIVESILIPEAADRLRKELEGAYFEP